MASSIESGIVHPEQLLRQLVEIPSISGQEGEVGSFIGDLLQEQGFTVTRQPVDAERFNVIATIGTPRVLLSSHLDTVPPYIPYSEDDVFIHGRGSCDTKGSSVAMITAAIQSKNEGLTNFGLIFTVGEETVLDGAKKVVESDIPLPFVVIGEPTNLELVNSHNGVIGVEIHAQGKAAHSSRPEQGVNALVNLIGVIQNVEKIDKDPQTQIVLTWMEGGTARNIVPEKALAVYSIRPAPFDQKDYVEAITRFAPEGVTVTTSINHKGVYTEVPRELLFIASRKVVPYFTELGIYGQNGVVLGPGDIIYAHSAEERVPREQLREAVAIYSQVIKNFCGT